MIKTILRSIMWAVPTETLNSIYDTADEEMWKRGEKKEIEDIHTHRFRLLQPGAETEPRRISQEEDCDFIG